MAGYRRWISYIYIYEEGIKKSNIGYVRVESLGQITKITVHMNVLSVSGSMKTYLFVRSPKGINGIYIGDVTVEKGVGRGVFSMESALVGESGYNISEMGGIIVYNSNERFFASEWDDKPIVIREFSVADEAGEAIQEEPSVQLNEEPQEEPSVQLNGAPQEEPAVQLNEEAQEEPAVHLIEEAQEEPAVQLNKEAQEEPDVQENEEPQEELGVGQSPDLVMQEGVSQAGPEEDLDTVAEDMLETYPQMYPFEDDEMLHCVRIEPQDIEKLPIDIWNLAGNSFLLRGYYSYRHLMLMKTDSKYNPVYLLGVPGIYHNKDNLVAEMFGFRLFKPMKKTDKVQGEFGYWCIALGK